MVVGTDFLDNDINDGDIIIQINNGWKMPGIVQGGMTKGGKIRYFSVNGHKESSHGYNMLKVSLTQLENLINQKREHLENRIAQDVNDIWANKMLGHLEAFVEKATYLEENK